MKLRARRNETILMANLVSFTDIAFNIVLFFMVAATFARSNALKVELPGGDSAGSDEPSLTLQADASNLLLNGTPVEIGALKERLRQSLEGKTTDNERVVVLLTSDDVSFQRCTLLMHTIRDSGGVVALMYEEDGG